MSSGTVFQQVIIGCCFRGPRNIGQTQKGPHVLMRPLSFFLAGTGSPDPKEDVGGGLGFLGTQVGIERTGQGKDMAYPTVGSGSFMDQAQHEPRMDMPSTLPSSVVNTEMR